MPRLAAVKLCGKLEPETVDPELAGAWAAAIGSDDVKLAAVLAEKELVSADRATAFA